MRGSLSAKGVLDTSQNGHNEITPEVSGIFSDTFADDRVGILLTAILPAAEVEHEPGQCRLARRLSRLREQLGLAASRAIRVSNINRPGPADVYQVPQNASYDFNDIDRERINGQAVLQFRPTDNLTGTFDYTFSQNTVETRNSNVGVWFNHGDISSEWTDGPVAGPIFYSEHFCAGVDANCGRARTCPTAAR